MSFKLVKNAVRIIVGVPLFLVFLFLLPASVIGCLSEHDNWHDFINDMKEFHVTIPFSVMGLFK